MRTMRGTMRKTKGMRATRRMRRNVALGYLTYKIYVNGIKETKHWWGQG
jgi:hypothetical protein